MPQLRVYRSFIKKAADSGKYLIIWDDQRRYEGQFKGFDPQGEFVILADVTIIDKEEEIHAPETLIPIENIKIVSTETDDERKKRLEGRHEVAVGKLMPGARLEEARKIEVGIPEKIETAEVVEEKEEVKPVIEETFEKEPEFQEEESKVIEEEISAAEVEAQVNVESEAERIPEAEKPQIEQTKEDLLTEKKDEAGDFVSVIESEVDTSLLSPETQELLQEIAKKAETVKESEVKPEPEVSFEDTKPQMVVSEAKKVEAEPEVKEPEITVLETKRTEVPGIEVKPEQKASSEEAAARTAAAQSAQPQAEVKTQTQTVTAGKTPKVIAEKSEKAARSKFFAKGETEKPSVPKRKVDIGTIILDIIIVILGIVAVGLLVITVLGIKLPF